MNIQQFVEHLTTGTAITIAVRHRNVKRNIHFTMKEQILGYAHLQLHGDDWGWRTNFKNRTWGSSGISLYFTMDEPYATHIDTFHDEKLLKEIAKVMKKEHSLDIRSGYRSMFYAKQKIYLRKLQGEEITGYEFKPFVSDTSNETKKLSTFESQVAMTAFLGFSESVLQKPQK